MNKKPMILIIEDEAINRKIICNLLKESYNILEADNGKSALTSCNKYGNKISAILLDLVMPVMNGYEFMKIIMNSEWNNIPILVMTGSSDRETERAALNSGAVDFIKKPYDALIIHKRLENAIARSKLTMYEEIEHRMEYDKLTGLYNREKMFTETRNMINGAPEYKYIFLRVDIDHFALYNSSFGEKAGNKLLCYFGNMFRRCAESFDDATYGRISADVFVLCARYDASCRDLEINISKAQNILNEYSERYLLKISTGACWIEDREVSIEEYYLRASLAAQNCKHQYGRIISFYNDTLRQNITTEINVTNDMRKALDDEQFLVYFQPKYNVSIEKPCGAEALVRWLHPDKGLISPGIFIPVFEKNGFIANLDYYMWEHTCQHLSRWRKTFKKVNPVSVNISRVSLYNPNLDKQLIELVNRYDIDPSLLELEITESAYMTCPEEMHELVRRLHRAGFIILMDDFGSDYSSLNALKDIEVDILKIDMAFIPQDDDVEKGEIILASIIKMAKWLGMSVIAEGVETRHQRDFLEGAGCDVIQGYYYSKPISVEEYENTYCINTDTDVTEEISHDSFQNRSEFTILVIDNCQKDCTNIESYLGKSYHVESCSSAEEGMMYLKRNLNAVKLIMVDNKLPGMTGIDFMRFCKNSNELQSIPKVLITENDQTQDKIAAFDAGAYDYIAKPLIREVVDARIRHIMGLTYHYSSYDKIQMEYYTEAERDALTGLLSRQSFRDLCSKILAAFTDDPMALMYIDIDDFEQIKQVYGVQMGTELLKQIAGELNVEFRRSDVIGRVGDNSFAVFLCGIPDKKTAKQKSSDIMREIAFLGARDYGIELSASVGLVYPVKSDTIEVIIAKADQALMEAKHAHNGTCVIYGEHVPAIKEGDKPIVMVCGGDELTFKEVALAYGDAVSFAHVKYYSELVECFNKYQKRIVALIIDINTRVPEQRDEFREFVRAHGVGENIPALALCKLGDIEQLRLAVSLNVCDLVPLPVQPDLIQPQLSLVIMRKNNKIKKCVDIQSGN